MESAGSEGASESFLPHKRTKFRGRVYFGFYKSAKGKVSKNVYLVCRTCRKNIAFTMGNTSYLMTYLYDQHTLLCKSREILPFAKCMIWGLSSEEKYHGLPV